MAKEESEESNEKLLQDISRTLSSLENSKRISRLVNEAIDRKIPITEIIEKGLRSGIERVGTLYEKGEYFLSELLFSSSLMNESMELLIPHLKGEKSQKEGKIVLGTVRGDIHDIGKNIFKMFAQSSGFEVYDLGVDVEPAMFIEKLNNTRAEILGLSALLTTTSYEMKTVIDTLTQEGIRNKVKVLIGGNAVNKEFAEEVGADAAARDAVDGVELCKRWVKRDDDS